MTEKLTEDDRRILDELHRANFVQYDDGPHFCVGDHNKDEDCHYEPFTAWDAREVVGIARKLLDALEQSERERERLERENEEYITKLERQNARLALQLDIANRALDKALKETT